MFSSALNDFRAVSAMFTGYLAGLQVDNLERQAEEVGMGVPDSATQRLAQAPRLLMMEQMANALNSMLGGGRNGNGAYLPGHYEPNFNGNFTAAANTSQSPTEAWNELSKKQHAVHFHAGMNIDTDGTGSSHGDDYHQNQTSMTLANGRSLNADTTPYIVLPPELAKKHHAKLGDLVLVKHGNKVSPAIYGDVGPSGKLGEGSTRLAKNLGINSNPNTGGIESGVHYQVFPGTGKGIHWTDKNTTTDALWQRIQSL